MIVGDRLFVVMQRLNLFQPTRTAYVAVFDVVTDTEVDTGMGGSDGLKGVPLAVLPIPPHRACPSSIPRMTASKRPSSVPG